MSKACISVSLDQLNQRTWRNETANLLRLVFHIRNSLWLSRREMEITILVYRNGSWNNESNYRINSIMSLNGNKTFELERKMTRNLCEFINNEIGKDLCAEATAAAISALCNCTVLFTWAGIDLKEQCLDVISSGINRAAQQREAMIANLQITFDIKNRGEQ